MVKRLVWGVGINDSDYVTIITEPAGCVGGKKKRKVLWRCPFYKRWSAMLERCYSEKYQAKRPTYKGCSVTKGWLTFSNFKRWMGQQNWEGMHLDKDILFPGNKIYSEDTCVFLDAKVNTFMLDCAAARGEWLVGVSFKKSSGKFEARCCCATTGKQVFLGSFEGADNAHQAWLKFKLKQAYSLAAKQTDERVANALIDKYQNFVNIEKAA